MVKTQAFPRRRSTGRPDRFPWEDRLVRSAGPTLLHRLGVVDYDLGCRLACSGNSVATAELDVDLHRDYRAGTFMHCCSTSAASDEDVHLPGQHRKARTRRCTARGDVRIEQVLAGHPRPHLRPDRPIPLAAARTGATAARRTTPPTRRHAESVGCTRFAPDTGESITAEQIVPPTGLRYGARGDHRIGVLAPHLDR